MNRSAWAAAAAVGTVGGAVDMHRLEGLPPFRGQNADEVHDGTSALNDRKQGGRFPDISSYGRDLAEIA